MNTINELQIQFCPFGYLDLEVVTEIWQSVQLSSAEVFDIINDSKEEMGYTEFRDIDPVYCILEHILQHTRSIIEELTGYDFINDRSWNGSEIYTYWNYMCSDYCWGDDSLEELKKEIQPHLEQLEGDAFCCYFLSELGLLQENWIEAKGAE